MRLYKRKDIWVRVFFSCKKKKQILPCVKKGKYRSLNLIFVSMKGYTMLCLSMYMAFQTHIDT
jgi:hypothetical protein